MMKTTRPHIDPIFIKKIQKIRMLVLDVDGVLTDGGVFLGSNGVELKKFDIQDGMGITLARMGSLKVGIITGRKSEAVEKRAKELKFDALYQGAKRKLVAYEKLLKTHKLKDEEICCAGDDLLDIELMRRAGLSVAVANARPEVQQIADITTQLSGGKGAVREIVELILKVQEKWEDVLQQILEGKHP